MEDVEADLTVVVDVGVEHFCEEADGGGFVGVVYVEGVEVASEATSEARPC